MVRCDLGFDAQPVCLSERQHDCVKSPKDVSTFLDVAVKLAEEAVDVKIHRLHHPVRDHLQLTGKRQQITRLGIRGILTYKLNRSRNL